MAESAFLRQSVDESFRVGSLGIEIAPIGARIFLADRPDRLADVGKILAERHGLGPGGLARLMEDDVMCREHVQRFLCEHQVAFPVPLYDGGLRYGQHRERDD